MSEQYIRYLPKFKITTEIREKLKDDKELKRLEELQPYISINPDQFYATENVRANKKNERKLNVRIKKHDLYLLDAIAKHDGISRSALINILLYNNFIKELGEIQDSDARALLAKSVDKQVDYDNLARPWVHDALEAEFNHVFDNFLRYNSSYEQQPPQHPEEPPLNSDLFIGLVKKLKGLKNEQ
jgi:hypothetical protein